MIRQKAEHALVWYMVPQQGGYDEYSGNDCDGYDDTHDEVFLSIYNICCFYYNINACMCAAKWIYWIYSDI